jgi:hypothetical protein
MNKNKFDAVEVIGTLIAFLAVAGVMAWALINLFS